MELKNKLLGSPIIELGTDSASIDTKSLCGSKHEVWVWVTDEDEDGVPNAFEDSIIIGFKGLDSSGGRVCRCYCHRCFDIYYRF